MLDFNWRNETFNGFAPLWSEHWHTLEEWQLISQGGGFGNQELQFYSPQNVSIEDGTMTITANSLEGNFTSGKLVCKKPLGVDSGYLEITVHNVPHVQGRHYKLFGNLLWFLTEQGTGI